MSGLPETSSCSARIAGFTIFLGLPLGRMRERHAGGEGVPERATATGILIFLLWDVLSAAVEPVETALRTAAADASPTSRRC